jgi:hypothetical protein
VGVTAGVAHGAGTVGVGQVDEPLKHRAEDVVEIARAEHSAVLVAHVLAHAEDVDFAPARFQRASH